VASGAAGRANVGLDLVADYFAPGEAAEYCICGFIGVSVCPCAYLRHHYCDRTSKLQRIFYAHDTCDSGLRLSKSYTGYQSRRGSSSSRACWSTKCYVNYDGLVYSLMQVYNRKKTFGGFSPWEYGSFPSPPTFIPTPSHCHSPTLISKLEFYSHSRGIPILIGNPTATVISNQ